MMASSTSLLLKDKQSIQLKVTNVPHRKIDKIIEPPNIIIMSSVNYWRVKLTNNIFVEYGMLLNSIGTVKEHCILRKI